MLRLVLTLLPDFVSDYIRVLRLVTWNYCYSFFHYRFTTSLLSYSTLQYTVQYTVRKVYLFHAGVIRDP